MTRQAARAAADAELARWEQALTDELTRLFDRQQQVVLSRLTGTKARKHTRHWEPPGERKIDARYVMDATRWVNDAAQACAPIVRRIFESVYAKVSAQLVPDEPRFKLDPAQWVHDDAGPDLEDAIQARLALVQAGVETASTEVQTFIDSEDEAGTTMDDLAAKVRELYGTRVPVWCERISVATSTGSVNQAGLLAAIKQGSAGKQWLSKRDEKVRDTHEAADGQSRPLMKRFRLGGIPTHPQVDMLMFPGDPSPNVPLDEVINCRCTLLFLNPVASRKAYEALETKDHVRTPAGAQQYGQPIGSVIVPDVARAGRMMARARAAEPGITKDLTELVSAAGGRLEGLDHRFKDEVTLAAKIPRSAAVYGSTHDEVESAMPDTVRYTAVFGDDDYTRGIGSVLAGFTNRGYKVEWQDSSWAGGDAYSGVNTNLRSPDGHLFEVQFHTDGSHAAKQANHADFEVMRDASRPLGERQAAWDRMTAAWSKVATPVGAESLPGPRSFPRPTKAIDYELEFKDHVRTPAGARHYGEPIGSLIVRDMPHLNPSFSSAPAAPSSSSRPKVVGRVEGMGVVDASNDPKARALIAKYSTPPPDPATTRVLAAYQPNGRIAAYVVWQHADGPQPKGTVVEVSVHPKMKGKRIGDQLVQLAAKEDPGLQVTSRPATTQAAPSTTVAAAAARSSVGSGKPALASSVAAGGMPTVRSRAQAGDQPGTSGDFTADDERVSRLQLAYMKDHADTQSLFSRGGRWSRAREAQQQQIIDHFLSQPGVKRDRKLLVLGGVPGAGKTTTINSPAGQAALGIDLSEYVTVNADDVKDEMVRRGMLPDYPGLSPEESATMMHAESFEVANALMRQAGAKGYNFAYDTSLKSTGQVGFAQSAVARSRPPYETTMLFVDVPLPVAKQRARDRYLAGGRFMPLGLIDGMKSHSRKYASRPSENFDLVKRQADRWVVFDNSGAAPVVVGSGGRRSKSHGGSVGSSPVTPKSSGLPAPARARSTPAPAPAPARAAAPAPAAAPTAAPLQQSGWTPPPGLPPVPPGALVYTHPQGKTIYVHPNGALEVYKPDGKKATSSATAAKLAAGHGGWTQVVGPDANPAGAAAAQAQVSSSKPATTGAAPKLVADHSTDANTPEASKVVPAPAAAGPIVTPMDFNEAPLSDVPKYINDPNYVFQQKVDGIRGVLVVRPGQSPWFASKKGDKLVSSTAAKITAPMIAAMPPTPAGSPSYRIEGELLNGKFHVFDMIVDGQEHLPYSDRKTMADAWVDAVSPALPAVQKLPTARTAKEKQALWDQVLASGAEGVMMKHVDSPYQGGARVNHTLKAKVTATADVVILDKGVGGHANAVMGLRVGGKTVPIGTVSTLGKGQLNVGDVVEVEYLWATPSNTLAQPRIKRVRRDKTPNDVTDATQLRQVDKTVLQLQAKALRLQLEGASW